MDFALDLLSTPSTLRATGGIMDKIKSFFKMGLSVPSWYSIRIWLLKFGLFKLIQPKQVADDWIWIADHSVQIGREKCLVVLGIRSKDLPKNRALALSDMEPLAVMPTVSSDRNVVFNQLSEVASITGVPSAIVSDAGPDLKAGLEDYCDFNRYKTRYIYDVTHWIANQLKSLFEADDAWMGFIEYASFSQSFMRQTGVAALMPPNQRSKARYLNIDIIIRWAQKIIELLSDEGKVQSMFDMDQVNRTLLWVKYFKDDIEVWAQILDIAETAKSVIKASGVYRGLANKLAKILDEQPCHYDRAISFRDSILAYAKDLEFKVHTGERVVACSDVIESLFGRFKLLEQQQSGSGFTQLLLAIPALVGKKSAELIKLAAETIKVKDLSEWAKNSIGLSVQAKRTLVFAKKKTKQKEAKQEELCTVF